MLVGGKWFWCCKDNIIFPLRRHRTARVFPTRRAFSVRPPHSARWAAPNCAFLPYPFTSSAPFFGFLLLFSSPFRYEEANIGNFPLKVPRFSSKVPYFRAFSPVFCRVPRPAHPPCAIRCIFPPHLRSATGVKRTSSIYSCTTSSDAGVPFPFRCRKVPSFLPTMRPSPRLLTSFAFKILLQLRPIPPHTSIFSDRLIRKFPLSLVINPTFPPLIGDTFSRHDTKAHDSHNKSTSFLLFCHSNSTFVV